MPHVYLYVRIYTAIYKGFPHINWPSLRSALLCSRKMDIHSEGNWQLTMRAQASAERRGYSGQRRAPWHDAPVLALDESGAILECSESCAGLFGFPPSELLGQHISALYPQLSGFRMFPDGQLNPMLRFLCHCGYPFQAMCGQGGAFKSELNFVPSEDDGRRSLRLVIRPLTDERATGVPNAPAD